MVGVEELWPIAVAPFVGSLLRVAATRLAPVSGAHETSLAAVDNRRRLFPTIEIAATAIAVAAAFSPGIVPPAWVTALFGWWLLALAATDAASYLLPDQLTLPLAAAGILEAALYESHAIEGRLVGLAAGYFACAGIAIAYRRVRGREGLGRGDWKLAGAAGAWVSWELLPFAFFVAALTGLLAALLGAFGRDVSSETRVPFGSFLALGSWTAWLALPLLEGSR